MSLVQLAEPDFRRFPRFRDALAAASVAELGRRRRPVHSDPLVAPRGVARREAQRPGRITGGTVRSGQWRGRRPGWIAWSTALLNRQADAGRTQASLGQPVRSLRLPRERGGLRAHTGTPARRAGKAVAGVGETGQGFPDREAQVVACPSIQVIPHLEPLVDQHQIGPVARRDPSEFVPRPRNSAGFRLAMRAASGNVTPRSSIAFRTVVAMSVSEPASVPSLSTSTPSATEIVRPGARTTSLPHRRSAWRRSPA